MKENELLFEQALGEKAVVTKSEDNLIQMSNGWSVSFFHDQDCCERVFAECDSVKVGTELDRIEIKRVDCMGVLLNGQLINCYNEQNGYYSDLLEMEISDGKKVVFKVDDVPKQDNIW